jgi:hypothetical protein
MPFIQSTLAGKLSPGRLIMKKQSIGGVFLVSR